MKRVILAALLLVNVSAQCKESFKDKSLKELIAMRDAQVKMIKETSEYKQMLEARQEHKNAMRKSWDSYSHDRCKWFRKDGSSWSNWLVGISQEDCDVAQELDELVAQKKELYRDAEVKFRNALAQNHPTLEKLCSTVNNKQEVNKILDTIDNLPPLWDYPTRRAL